MLAAALASCQSPSATMANTSNTSTAPSATTSLSILDPLYSVLRNESLLRAKPFVEPSVSSSNTFVVASVSNNNVLAFSSNINLLGKVQKYMEVYVYVVDLNLPYFPYQVTVHEENITLLEWDDKGTKLLIGDEAGNIQTWCMRDYLISEWELGHNYCITGDCIQTGAWFHRGLQLRIQYEKKDLNIAYQEKYKYSYLPASVVQFGYKPAEGFLCITSSGFIYAHIICSDSKTMTHFDLIDKNRFKVHKVDIAYMENGQYLLATTDSNPEIVRCYTVKVTINYQEKQKLNLTCQPFAYITLNSYTTQPGIYTKVTDIRFVTKLVPDALIVTIDGKSGSIIELWELIEKPMNFHKAIHNLMQQQNHKIAEMQINQMSWKYCTMYMSSLSVSTITTPRMSLFDSKPALSYIMVTYPNNVIKCFHRDGLQMLAEVNLKKLLTQRLNGESSSQSNKLCSKMAAISNVQLTWSSCVLIVIDLKSQLHLFRVAPVLKPSASMSINYAQMMFEYSLISGNDYWDILVSIKPSFVDTICEQITENFLTKQNQSMQQKWLNSVLQLKSTLYRCVSSGPSAASACKAGDYHTIKMLNAIAETVKRLIRAREYLENEGPAEKLSFLIQNKQADAHQLNVDKILFKLDNKDFCVEVSIQQSFQHLLQWVCDLSLYLLASIPQQYHYSHYRLPGVGLLFDQKSLNTLRELLVIIRFWSIMNSHCLPMFNRMQESIDVIPLLFKLLSKIVTSSPEKLDETLVDECCVLPNQVLIPQLDLCPKSIGVANPVMYANSSPLIFEFGQEPNSLKFNMKVPTIDGAINYQGNRKIDVIRYIALGVGESNSGIVRNCTRCNAASLLKTPMRSPAARAWEHQWIKKCFCGGLWRKHYPS